MTAPTTLQFNLDKTAYASGETLNLTDAWVYDAEGTTDLAKIDFWLQKPDGNWVDLSDASNFTAWSEDPSWANFNYSLDLTGYVTGTYTLEAQAFDQLGQASDGLMTSFAVQNSAPSALQFNPDMSRYSNRYYLGETLNVTDALVYNAEGTTDLARIDFWLQKPDGNWVDLSDTSNFTASLQDPSWASFNYSLDLTGYGTGSYTLWAQAFDQLGQASDGFMTSFTVETPIAIG